MYFYTFLKKIFQNFEYSPWSGAEPTIFPILTPISQIWAKNIAHPFSDVQEGFFSSIEVLHDKKIHNKLRRTIPAHYCNKSNTLLSRQKWFNVIMEKYLCFLRICIFWFDIKMVRASFDCFEHIWNHIISI